MGDVADFSAPMIDLVFDQGSLTPIEMQWLDMSTDPPTPIPLPPPYSVRTALVADDGTVLLSMTVGNGSIVITDTAAGKFTQTIKATDTNMASDFQGVEGGTYDTYADPTGVPSATSKRIVGGRWRMNPESTP
jgi:hypothetical protein